MKHKTWSISASFLIHVDPNRQNSDHLSRENFCQRKEEILVSPGWCVRAVEYESRRRIVSHGF